MKIHRVLGVALFVIGGCANWPKTTSARGNTVTIVPGGVTAILKGFGVNAHSACTLPPGQSALAEKLDNEIAAAYKGMEARVATKYETTITKLFEQTERLLALQHVLSNLCFVAENGGLNMKTKEGRDFYKEVVQLVMATFEAHAAAAKAAAEGKITGSPAETPPQNETPPP